jgi:hypothetical protein
LCEKALANFYFNVPRKFDYRKNPLKGKNSYGLQQVIRLAFFPIAIFVCNKTNAGTVK